MKNILIVILVIILLGAAGTAGWYFFLKKSPEGGSCQSAKRCEQGLKCANKICSSGKVGAACAQKSDCQSGFCVNNTCTEGKEGDTCATYKDCESSLLCTKSICTKKPDYSKYFDKVTVSKIKPGMPPGPSNPATPTTTFSKQDAIEVDFGGVKTTTVGPYYFEFVNSTTGETVNSTKGLMDTNFEGRDTGSGTDFSTMASGEYDLNVYFQNELVYSVVITLQ